MNDIRFEVGDLNIDYRLIGIFPKNIDKIKSDEELLNLFMDCFKHTFTTTVFNYYGELKECREQIENSLLLDELDFKNKNYRQKWQILLLIVLDMFFRIHNTYFAQKILFDVIENFDEYTEEELMTTIYDLNFALFFAIEECIVISPSCIKLLEASDEDVLILPELIENKDEIIKILRHNIRRSDIKAEIYEELFKEEIDKNFHITLYDALITSWIDLINIPCETETTDDFDIDTWENLSAEVFAIITSLFSLLITDEDKLFELSEELYYYIVEIIRERLDIEYEVFSISL